MNNNLEITSVCSTLCLSNNYPIFNYFAVHGTISFKQTPPVWGFYLYHPWALKLFSAGFSSRFPSFLSSTDRWNLTIIVYIWCDRTNSSFDVYIIEFCLFIQFELIVNALIVNPTKHLFSSRHDKRLGISAHLKLNLLFSSLKRHRCQVLLFSYFPGIKPLK